MYANVARGPDTRTHTHTHTRTHVHTHTQTHLYLRSSSIKYVKVARGPDMAAITALKPFSSEVELTG